MALTPVAHVLLVALATRTRYPLGGYPGPVARPLSLAGPIPSRGGVSRRRAYPSRAPTMSDHRPRAAVYSLVGN